MNIRNLVSTALSCAGLSESEYDVRIHRRNTIYVSVCKTDAYKSIRMIIGTDEDDFVTDFMVSEENLSPVIGNDAYERFINRMTEETYISI
jgi:hypothetical protein